jgi:hypothetical protein
VTAIALSSSEGGTARQTKIRRVSTSWSMRCPALGVHHESAPPDLPTRGS